MSSRGLLRILENNEVAFWCPGCESAHVVDERWQFNGNYDLPTFTPSYKSLYRHPKGCTKDNPAPLGYAGDYATEVCHSYVTEGRIRFLEDCTHRLKNQTVLLFPF